MPRLVDAERPLQRAEDDDEQDKLDPHAAIDQPQRRHEEGRPGEALFHELQRSRRATSMSGASLAGS